MAEKLSSEKGKGKEKDGGEGAASLEKFLEGMKLHGEEEDDLDFSEDFEELVKEVRWLALFRVHTTKPFSHAALFNALRNAWAAAKEVTFKAREPNLFVVQFHCLRDWTRVMDGRPWLFRGAAIVMEEYDGYSNVKAYKLDKIPIWARIQGVPEMLMKKKELAEKVAKKVGETIMLLVNDGKINSTPYLKARVWIDLNKPLVRMVPITLKERMICLVQYEKLPSFCFFCGCLGHEVAECGDGVHPKEKCEWGDWLKVPFTAAMIPRDDRGGRGGGRGRGRGRGFGRGGGGYDEAYGMDISVETEADDVELQAEGRSANLTGRTPMLEDSTQNREGVSPLAEQEKKRPRRSEDGEDNKETPYAKSALSFEESVRAQ
ncbi:uncharacterized protein LOC120675055 [Panicum virgatum]|uniref:uncharacterized protein LOC120675055 n=1 Tax=Panicum virgatum TaxID=38727 RepID=UPI0019D53DBD|nr:uncharacterized protein LOC120675055 [Panicum virgatum]